MKTSDYLGAVIIIICCGLLWYRTGELENHLNLTAGAVESLNKRMAIIEAEDKYIQEIVKP